MKLFEDGRLKCNDPIAVDESLVWYAMHDFMSVEQRLFQAATLLDGDNIDEVGENSSFVAVPHFFLPEPTFPLFIELLIPY